MTLQGIWVIIEEISSGKWKWMVDAKRHWLKVYIARYFGDNWAQPKKDRPGTAPRNSWVHFRNGSPPKEPQNRSRSRDKYEEKKSTNMNNRNHQNWHCLLRSRFWVFNHRTKLLFGYSCRSSLFYNPDFKPGNLTQQMCWGFGHMMIFLMQFRGKGGGVLLKKVQKSDPIEKVQKDWPHWKMCTVSPRPRKLVGLGAYICLGKGAKKNKEKKLTSVSFAFRHNTPL